ncbi:PRC-barrel domain-containing protein [Oceanobacillus damuensis]|uniref:PRC-barrel domain-containing protein n=1 Tax=Oceanobacillus damuensis TaxID=937928 RepID=UPI00082D3083|nr:PRC-barrel domain-containing protein [Oceanobacillus damuensis]
MYNYTSQIKNYNIHATDGEMGKIKDLYIDDKNWEIRYAIVDTRKWLPGRKVLLPPSTFTAIHEEEESVDVEYDKDTVRNSPPVPENEDLSSDQESTLMDYFGWNTYRSNALLGPDGKPLGTFEHDSMLQDNVPEEPHAHRPIDGHRTGNGLRSEDETIGFKVHAKDGKIGKITDMIYDTEHWEIKYIVVKTSDNFTEDELYIYRTEQIGTVDWFEKDLYINDSVAGISSNKPFTDKKDIIASLSYAR